MTKARLRVIPGGFRYVSDGLCLDLLRYGIILRKATPMPTGQQRRLMHTLKAIGRNLGFERSSDSDDLLPPQDGTIAVHAIVKAWDAALLNMMSIPVSEEPSIQEAVEPRHRNGTDGLPDATEEDVVTDSLRIGWH